MAARRAVFRWASRLFRREWRQQLLVLVLLTVTVAASIFGALAARGVAGSADAEFGSADHQLRLTRTDPDALATTLDDMAGWFGTIDVIGSHQAPVPGSVTTVEYRSQDPAGPFSAPMLALRSGRYPTGDEAAITSALAKTLDLAVGDQLDLDGVRRPITGIVENPSDLDDQFALVAPGDPLAAAHTVLVRTDDDRVRGFHGGQIDLIASRGQDESDTAAAGALSLAVVVAILVCLVSAAGFVVLAQRRLRQLGMLAAVGATERHLRMVVVANGVLVGAVSGVAGAALVLAVWVVANPMLERAAARRLDRSDVPWWIVAAGMAIALATSTAAAWWPGRAIARVPVTRALSSRPPEPRPVHRSAVVAGALIAAGFAGLAVGIDTTADDAQPLLVLAGIAALVIGILLLSPLAIRSLAPIGDRSPIAIRLALRDLIRHQARSGVALAAITLSLALAVATVIIAGAARNTPDDGNLASTDVLVRLGSSGEPSVPDLGADELAARGNAAERLAASLDATAVPLSVAINPGAVEDRDGVAVHPAVVLGRPAGHVIRDSGMLYVATPELVDHLGIDLATIPADTDIITPQDGTLVFANTLKRHPAAPVVAKTDGPAYSHAPTSLLPPAALARHGWVQAPAGWLIETTAPLTAEQIHDARQAAVTAGMTIETRDAQESLTTVRTWATVIGMGLALAILAMTVGLMRGEAANEVRTLTAAGASSRTRRAIVAATAGALAALGVLLGTAGAYLALVASYLEDLTPLGNIPVVNLAVTLLGVPVLAAAAGWLLAGRERPLTRPAVE